MKIFEYYIAPAYRFIGAVVHVPHLGATIKLERVDQRFWTYSVIGS